MWAIGMTSGGGYWRSGSSSVRVLAARPKTAMTVQPVAITSQKLISR
jgi:hypothetical protein